jgi:tyrosine-protein kinase Etk/Wzc
MINLEQEPLRASAAAHSADPDNIDVLDILLVLTRRKRMIGTVSVAALCIGVLTSLLLKPNFTATAAILPPQQQSSSSSLMGQLGSLAALGGGASVLGIKSPADMYVGILQCRTIADEIISQFHLESIYKRKKRDDTRTALRAHTEIEAGKDNLIRISVTDHDPNRARDLANAYVDELYRVNSNLAITEAAQRRVFFDQQLDAEKKALALAEDDLRATEQRTGLIQLSGQAQMIIQSIAQLRAEIASREVEMQAMRTFATEQNPDLTRLQEVISTMRRQLTMLEDDQARQQQPGNIALPAGRVAEDSLEYARKFREVKYHESLFDLLSRQYEAARIDEAKSAPIIQVIDRAVAPDKKSGPHGSLITIGLGILGFSLACAWAFIGQGLRNLRRSPEYAEKFQHLIALSGLRTR